MDSIKFFSSSIYRTVEVISIYNDDTNTWNFTTTFNHIDYKSENVVFNPHINSFKKVSKLLDMCKNNITHTIENNTIIITIEVDFIDDEKIILKLDKNMMSYEELEMKYISLSEKIADEEDTFFLFISLLANDHCRHEKRSRCFKKHLSSILEILDTHGCLPHDRKWVDELRRYISKY